MRSYGIPEKLFLYFICLFQFKVRYITSLQEKNLYIKQQSIL